MNSKLSARCSSRACGMRMKAKFRYKDASRWINNIEGNDHDEDDHDNDDDDVNFDVDDDDDSGARRP